MYCYSNVLDTPVKEHIRIFGLIAALVFGMGPFITMNIGGRGIVLYLSIIYIACLVVHNSFSNNGKIHVIVGKTEKFYLAMMAWRWIACIWSPAISSDSIYSLFKVNLFYLMFCVSTFNVRESKLILKSHTLIAIVSAFLMIRMGVTYAAISDGRYVFSFFGVDQDPNYICFLFIIPFVFFLSIILDDSKFRLISKIVSAGFLLFILYAVLCTGSRGGLLALAIGSLAYLFLMKKTTLKKFVVISICVIGVVVAYNYLIDILPQSVASRFSIEMLVETNGSNRGLIWQKYFTSLFKNPLAVVFGYGIGAGVYYIGSASHNFLIETWFEFGLVGLWLLVSFLVSLFKDCLKNNKMLPAASLLGAVVLALTLSVGNILQYWICITLIEILSKSIRNR